MFSRAWLRERPRIALGLAFAAGAAMVAGFAPPGLWPLAILAPAALAHLLLAAPHAPRAALTGFVFGLGLFGVGVSWVYVSLNQFGGMPAPIAAFATFGFCVILALYPAAVGYLQARLRVSDAMRAAVAIPALWTLTEWARGWVLTGFPWLSTGYAFVDTPLAGFAPVAGVHALGLLGWMSAGLLWCALALPHRAVAIALLAATFALGAVLRAIEWTQPNGAPLEASLLQGNIAQEMKFQERRYAGILGTYLRLAGASRAKLIVLPETALPRFLDNVDPAYLGELEAIAKRNGGDLLLGIPLRTGPGEYFNSVMSLGISPRQFYHKGHLVPFGEFVPPGFAWILAVLQIPLSDFSRGAATQRPLAIAGERVAANVCYEDAFGDEIIRQLPAATLLVNVSNVAWFGDSMAPEQHLQIGRMRALETGRMLLTSTNTGITAAIGRDGSVHARLPQFVEGRLDATVQGYSGTTPYVRAGDWAALGAALALLLSLRIKLKFPV